MKKRGFTLVELLAVIVILSIIALITVPVILDMVEDSRKQATVISGKEYVDYVSTRIVSDKLEDINFRDGNYDVHNDGKEIRSSDQTMDINMKGTLPLDGWIKIKNHQVVEAWLVFGKYEYHYILTDDGDIIQTITKVGEVAPDINLILQSTTNSIAATVERKNQYKIKSYRFKLDDRDYHQSNNNQYVFTKLDSDKEYSVTVECINTTGGIVIVTSSIKTKDIDPPTYETGPASGWATKKTVTITYPKKSDTLINPIYEYKVGKNNDDLDNQSWIRTDRDSFSYTFKENGIIVARVSDGTNYKTSSTLNVEQIDNTPPTDTAPTVSINSSGKATITLKQTDPESGIDTSSIKYYYRKSTESSWRTASSNVVTGLDEKTEYDFKTEATNNAGLKTTSKESETKTTCSISAPVIRVTSENQYVVAPSKTVGVTFASNCGDTWKYEYSINGGPWLETKNNPFSYTFKENGTIAARVSDDSRTKTSSTLTLTDISPYIGLPNTTREPGDYVEYAGEKWKVVKDNGGSVTLILAKNYTTAVGAYGINQANQFYNANANLQSEASNGGLVKHSETGSYVRLIKKDEVSSLIPNDSGTPFWTMSTEGTDSHASSIKYWYALSNGATSYTNYTAGESSGLYRGYSTSSLPSVNVDTELKGESVSTVAPSSVASVVTGSTYTATNIGYFSPLHYGFRPSSSSTISTYGVGTASMGASNPDCYVLNGKCVCHYGTSTITNSSQKIAIGGQQKSQQYCSSSGITSFNYTTPSLSWTAYGSKTGSSTTKLDTYNRCPGQVLVPVNFTCYSNCSSSVTSSTTYYYAGTAQSACSSKTQYTVSQTTSAIGVRPVITVNKRK